MNKIRKLQLVPVNFSATLRTLHAAGQAVPEAVSYCLGKGNVQGLDDLSASLSPWQSNTLRALPQELHAAGMAAAALTWRGEGGLVREGTWMNITLVHFSAGLNDVQIVPAEEVAEEQVLQLMSALQPLLSLSGFELHRSASGRWYLWCAAIMDVHTPAMERGVSTRSYDVLPTGRDSAALRRLLTEMQMVLYQHPVNQQREVQGVPPLNAVWLSGAGALTPATTSTLQTIMSDEPYLVGLCGYVNANCFPVPRTVDELLQVRSDDVVIVMQVTDAQQFDSQWLRPLLNAVKRGQIDSFHLYLDHARVLLKGGRMQQLRRSVSVANPLEKLLPEVLH